MILALLIHMCAHYTVKGTPLTIGLQVNNLFDKTYFAQSLGNQLMPAAPRSTSLAPVGYCSKRPTTTIGYMPTSVLSPTGSISGNCDRMWTSGRMC